jgi:hypothetical protein
MWSVSGRMRIKPSTYTAPVTEYTGECVTCEQRLESRLIKRNTTETTPTITSISE